MQIAKHGHSADRSAASTVEIRYSTIPSTRNTAQVIPARGTVQAPTVRHTNAQSLRQIPQARQPGREGSGQQRHVQQTPNGFRDASWHAQMKQSPSMQKRAHATSKTRRSNQLPAKYVSPDRQASRLLRKQPGEYKHFANTNAQCVIQTRQAPQPRRDGSGQQRHVRQSTNDVRDAWHAQMKQSPSIQKRAHATSKTRRSNQLPAKYVSPDRQASRLLRKQPSEYKHFANTNAQFVIQTRQARQAGRDGSGQRHFAQRTNGVRDAWHAQNETPSSMQRHTNAASQTRRSNQLLAKYVSPD